MNTYIRTWLPCFLIILLAPVFPGFAEAPVAVRVESRFYNPNMPLQNPYTPVLIKLMRNDPSLQIHKWGGINLPSGTEASLMMALAAGSAPDIGMSFFHTIGSDINQNFLYPLNEWIGDDRNGNGILEDHEIKWAGWKKINPLWREIVTVNGKIYGLPLPIQSTVGIIFRTDMVKAAGLDPNRPPDTWDEFYFWCRKLTDPDREIKGAMIQQGQCAIALPTAGHMFLPWIQSAGGEPFLQFRRSPKTGVDYSFPMDAEKFDTPDGENLVNVRPVWRANWNTPEGLQALRFWYKLRWGVWENNGRKLTGVARIASSQRSNVSVFELLGNGEVAMIMADVNDLEAVGNSAKIDPSLLSWFPIPAAPGPNGRRIVQEQRHYAVIYAGLEKRSRQERDAVWKTLTAIVSPAVLDNSIRTKALGGMSRFIPPSELKRLGYEEYIRDVPLMIRRNFADIASGAILSKTEPYAGHWLVIDLAFNRQVLGIMLGANGRDFDYETAFANLQKQANSGMMFEIPEEIIAKYRLPAKLIAALIILIMVLFFWKLVISCRKKTGVSRSVYSGWLPVLLLVPALFLIACWKYYPLLRGMFMALQDYKIVGESKFVGLDNFIILAMDNSFWMSILRTFYYVILNMLLAFLSPIVLAILLTEIPRGKIFFRTLFFLPQMTSGIVIALMWKLMYNPTPAGFFNQLLAWLNHIPGVHIEPQTYLEDPSMAMICCIIPSVWAGMGMASLVYLAALQSLPKELYEAAEVDGAGFMKKLTHITIPYLLPLIVINFVGAFIGTFQSMGNIFLLTFGGPGEATMVLGMKIWQEAYVNLRFSMATSMAWVMGAGLIGLTYLQIQFLKKVEYKKAGE